MFAGPEGLMVWRMDEAAKETTVIGQLVDCVSISPSSDVHCVFLVSFVKGENDEDTSVRLLVRVKNNNGTRVDSRARSVR